MDVKSTWLYSYMASYGSCFMVTWIISKNCLLEVGLTPKRETKALWTLTSIGLLYFYHVWGLAWIESHWISNWLSARSHMTSHCTWGFVTTLHDFEGVLRQYLDTFFWALTISLSNLLAHVWSSPNLSVLWCMKDRYMVGEFRQANESFQNLNDVAFQVAFV
jgi:hypothetical protein